jgi:Rrf2 family protein
MRLNTKARYALRAMVHVAIRGEASAQSIAEQQGIPSRYLEEIIGALRRAGFVVGKRGPRGGYRLAKDPETITVPAVLEALASGTSPAPAEPRDELVRTVERALDARLAAALEGVHLGQLVGEARERQRRSAANYVI